MKTARCFYTKMEKEGVVVIEGTVDPLKLTQLSLDNYNDDESKKGKKSPFFGAKDAIKKFVRNGSSRSVTKANLNDAHGEAVEDTNSYTKQTKSNVVYKTIHLRARVRRAPGADATEEVRNISQPITKERRSRWSRSKAPSPTKQLVDKKMNVKDVPEKLDTRKGNEKDSSRKEAVKIKSSSRFKPPQNPTEVDMESVTQMLRLMGISIEGKLGEGTYAKVRSAFNAKLGKRVALKIVSRSRLNTRFQRKFLPRELKVLQTIKHENIIELYQVIEKKDKLIMVMELARHGDLLEYVQKKKALPNNEARTIFSHILNAVEYLHYNGIFHRDLKCENVLLDWGNAGLVAKITDFGFSREWREPYRLCRTYCGSAAYASPEILQGIPYDPHGTDIWSIGVVLFIMLTGRMPYDDSNVTESLSAMMNDQLDWPSKRPICKEAKDLLGSILRHELRERATIPQIRTSAWMEGRIERVKLTPARVRLPCPAAASESPETKEEMTGPSPGGRNAV